MNLNSRNGPKGDSGPKAQTHKATRKFHAIWCLWWAGYHSVTPSFCLHPWCLMVSFIRPQVGENDFILEKTQEQKGFIYDDYWWLSLNPFPTFWETSSSCLSSMNDESILYHFHTSADFRHMCRKMIFFRRRHKSKKDSFMMIVFKSLRNILRNFILVSILHHDYLNQWMMNHRLSVLYHFPLIAMVKMCCGHISSTVTYSGV